MRQVLAAALVGGIYDRIVWMVAGRHDGFARHAGCRSRTLDEIEEAGGTRVQLEHRDLEKFGERADAMHEADGDPAKVMSDDFLVSPDEWALTMEIGEIVERLTKEQFGRAVRPWSAPLFALHPFRMIEEIAAMILQELKLDKRAY